MRSNLSIAVVLFLIGCKASKDTSSTSLPKDAWQDSVIVSHLSDYRAAYARTHDLIHTRLELSFDWETEVVQGVADLYLIPYFYETSTLVLDAKGFVLEKVNRVVGSDTFLLNYVYDNDQIVVEFDEAMSRRDTLMIHIEYSSQPDVAVGKDEKGVYFINHDRSHPHKPMQIWTHGQPEYNSNWFPTIDAPNERCTQEIFLTVADSLNTISNGSLIWSRENNDGTRTDYWRQNRPHAPYLFMIAVGAFEAVNYDHEKVSLTCWVEGEYAEDARHVFANTAEMLDFFSTLLDYPYPWEKYDQIIVRDFVSGAMENTGASVFMEDLMVRKSFLNDDHWDGIISHELFHQWFGNLVTCESWANLSLNEAFASYAEYLWIDYKYGPDEAAWHGMNELSDYLQESTRKQEPIIRYYYEDVEDMFDQHTYAKGSRVLHMLRNFVGDEAFFTSLHHYLKANKFSSVEIHDLRRSFEKVTGEDLNWFFEQWFLSPGHPELAINHVFVDDTLYIEVEQTQDLNFTPLYYLPLYMDLSFNDTIYQYPMQIMDQYHLFKLPLSRKPEAIVIDSEYVLVGTLEHSKSKNEWFEQLKLQDTFQSRYMAVTQLLDADSLDNFSMEAIRLGLQDGSPRIRELTLSFFAYADNPELSRFSNEVRQLLGSGSSKVRSAALIAAEGLGLMDENMWTQFLADSSFLVKGLALDYLLSRSNIRSRELFHEFKDHENINIVLSIGNYINTNIQAEQIDWYIRRLHSTIGNDIFYVLQLMTNYLLEAPQAEKLQAVDVLFDLTVRHTSASVRLAAYHGLLAVETVEGVSEKLLLIKSQERDPELIKIYNQY